MKDASQEIANLADEKMNVVVVSPTSPSQPVRGTTLPPTSPEQFKPEDIANSLSVIEGEFYSKITQADYIAHLRGTPVTKHIASATEINNRLVNWVKVKIIWSSEDVNKRAANFKLFVLVAEECRKSQNFSSMSAIVAALQSIPQLILTRETKLTKNEKRLLPQLDEILAPQGDHRAYREALQNGESPFAVPWLAVHLRTLQTFYGRSSPTVIVDQRPQINFKRCTKLLERIDDIRRYCQGPSPSPPPPLSPPPSTPPPPDVPPAKAKATKTKDKDRRRSGTTAPAPSMSAVTWVKKELDKAPSAISREQFETRVSALAEIERQMRERHQLELRSLGFETAPVPRHHRTSSSGSPRSPGSGRIPSLDSRLGKI
jgi:son of sevenless-like protein